MHALGFTMSHPSMNAVMTTNGGPPKYMPGAPIALFVVVFMAKQELSSFKPQREKRKYVGIEIEFLSVR